jgi:hypothetical protein
MARFGAAGMPSLYVIDRRGIVRAVVTDRRRRPAAARSSSAT